MNNTERAGKLLEARKIVLEVLATLNRKEDECSGCHLKKAEDWPEAQKGHELEALANKLDKAANGFLGMDNPKAPKGRRCPK